MSEKVLIKALVLTLGAMTALAHALDYPHNDYVNNIGCNSCHDVHSGTDDLLPQEYQTPPQNIDDTLANNLCWSCHNDIVAPYVKTHSSLTTDNRYGDWSVECKTCHDPHQQMQFRTYGSESYLYSGTILSITSTTLTVGNPGWTPDQYKGLVVIPNINNDYYNYKIIGNTNDTLVVEGTMDLVNVAVGNTFAIVYGKLIKSKILTPNSGDKTVKFFRDSGINSFADGDTIYNGICEVCHTQTTYHRNDNGGNHTHNVGTKCTQCHQHTNGFRGMGGGAHQVHVMSNSGPQVTCATGNLGCHGANSPPLFSDGQYLANTTVCDKCHSTDGEATAKQYWNNPGSSEGTAGSWAVVEGEASFCGSCHDATPGNTEIDGSGSNAPNVMGDNLTYGFYVTGHGKPSGNYTKLSWQDVSANGNPAANKQCSSCHDLTSQHFNNDAKRLRPGYENDNNNSNCKQCHPPGTDAAAAPQFYTTYEAYQNSAHGAQKCTTCHDVHGTAGTYVAMTKGDRQSLCYQCHTEGVIQNNAISGAGLADDIQQAFNLSEKHDLGTSFTINSKTYTLECSSCHNVHIITGEYWDADYGLSPVTRFANNTDVWGDEPGEKMDDFAAIATGSGGWYFSVARGGVISFDQPAVYQPPKKGSGYNFEFGGDVLPDYATFCLDCHTYRMSAANPPVNWGQGIGCTGNSVDPPDQRIACNAPHGLGSANRPYYWGDVGMYGSSGNPDPIFNEPGVTRGRGAGHFMRWPYDSVHKNAGINFVMSCTDCHEAHGSNASSMLRATINAYGPGTSNWNTMCNNCHYYYGGQHDGMSCGNASCHEANSIHRIIKNGEYSSATYLWIEPSRPTTTPEIASVKGNIASNELAVTFTEGVWTNMDQTGALVPEDFVLTDVGGNNPKTITNVTHTPGASTATVIMSAPLIADDINNDTLATAGISIWNANDAPAGPWTIMISLGHTAFQLNEAASSNTAMDDTGLIIGIVNDPNGTFLGDGYFHGDGNNNYIDFENNDTYLKASIALTIEARIKPSGIGTDNYIRRILARDSNQNYQMSVWRNNSWDTYNAPDGVASIAFWVSPVDKHGGKWWKPVMTDYGNYPIVSDHWYKVKIVWDSNKTGGIPCDIFVDDQGPNGDDVGENWSGYKNATDSNQSQLTTDRYLYEGDQIMTGDGDFTIGCNVNNHSNNVFDGLIDWIIWQGSVDYSGVDNPP